MLSDTVLRKDCYIYTVLPHDSVYPNFVSGFCKEGLWEYAINNGSKDSTLHIFTFKTNKLNKSIIKNRNYERYDLKVKELDSLKWRVEINDEDMKW